MKRSRRVSFRPRTSVRQSRFPSPALKMKSSLFYSKGELNEIARQAKKIADSKKIVASNCVVGLGDEYGCLRGLEWVAFPARRSNTMLVRKQILKCHRLIAARDDVSLDRKQRMLAEASSKITEWARRISLETARIDSLRVLAADYPIPVQPIPVEITSMTSSKRRKSEKRHYSGQRASSQHRTPAQGDFPNRPRSPQKEVFKRICLKAQGGLQRFTRKFHVMQWQSQPSKRLTLPFPLLFLQNYLNVRSVKAKIGQSCSPVPGETVQDKYHQGPISEEKRNCYLFAGQGGQSIWDKVRVMAVFK